MGNIVKDKITYIEGIIKQEEGVLYAYSNVTGQKLCPLHKNSLAIKVNDKIYYAGQPYTVVDKLTVDNLEFLVIDNGKSRATVLQGHCSRIIEGVIVYGRVVNDYDPDEKIEEFEDGKVYVKKKYFLINWEINPDLDKDLNDILSLAFTNALKNTSTVVKELNALGYKLQKI